MNLLPMLKFIAIFAISFFLVVASFISQVAWPHELSTSHKVVYLHRILTDFLVITAISTLFYSRHFVTRIGTTLLIVIFALVYFIQSESYKVAGTFLPLIALENSDHVDFVVANGSVTSAAIWVVALIVFVFLLARTGHHKTLTKPRLCAFLLFIALTIVVKNDDVWVSENVTTKRFEFYNSGLPGIKN